MGDAQGRVNPFGKACGARKQKGPARGRSLDGKALPAYFFFFFIFIFLW